MEMSSVFPSGAREGMSRLGDGGGIHNHFRVSLGCCFIQVARRTHGITSQELQSDYGVRAVDVGT